MPIPIDFQHPNSDHLTAASGWLDLGDHLSANEELEKITPELRAHPAVLDLRWQIYAKGKEWEGAIEIGRILAVLTPDNPVGSIYHAYALHAMKRTQEAWDTLFSVAAKFPDIPLIPFNLACYAAQLGQLPEALDLLKKAFELGGTKYKLMAFDDQDLKPLWDKIGEIP